MPEPVATVVVAGAGVVPDGVEAVRQFARETGVGVFNSFAVKGLFRWDDPAHFGTVGLQARDLELSGVLDAPLVLAVGLGDDVIDVGALGPRATAVEPEELASWASRVVAAPRGPFYDRVRRSLLPLYESDTVPLTPAAAVSDIPACLPSGALVCADPGRVGLWVARALPTLELGSVFVPRRDEPDAALQHARMQAARGRPVLYITDRAVVDVPTGVVVEQWRPDGERRTRIERRTSLQQAMGTTTVVTTAVDLDLTQVLIDVAGPVTAW